MALGRVFRRNADIVDRHILDEMLLVPIRGELSQLQRIFALNPAGELIWSQLDGRSDLQAVAHRVTEEFAVELEQAEEDVATFVTELAAAGLVTELTGV